MAACHHVRPGAPPVVAARRCVRPIVTRLVAGVSAAAAAFVLTACSGAPTAVPRNGTPTGTTTESHGDRAATVRAFFSAYGGADAAPLRQWSSAGTPARAYADYWDEVVRAGRTSAVPEQVGATARRATLTYADGSTYRFEDLRFDEQNRLVSWRNVPGGPLARRIVARQRTARIGPLRLRVLHQFRTPDGDLRITLTAGNTGRRSVNLARRAPRSYVSPDGRHSIVTMGSGDATGVVPVAAGSEITVLVSADRAEPGGRLAILAYDQRERPRGQGVIPLPGP